MTDQLKVTRAAAATIPGRYAREIVARLPLPPAGRQAILQRAGIATGRLREPGYRLTREQFETVYRGALHDGGDEAFGYTARPVPPGAYAFLLRALTGCADLAACLERSDAFYRLFDPEGAFTVRVAAGVARLRLQTSSRAQADSILITHGRLLAPWRTSAWLAGRPLPLSGVTLPARFRRFADETRYLFGCAPELGAVSETRFPAAQLALPVVRGAAEVPAYLAESLRGLLVAAPGDRLEARVRGVLAQWQPFAAAGIDDVARALAMSRPTLARHLRRIGTTFAALRDELRRDYAITLLGRGARLADVAEALDYSEASAFQRAFKTWTGVPPRRYVTAARRRS